jgi:hypothetical protein
MKFSPQVLDVLGIADGSIPVVVMDPGRSVTVGLSQTFLSRSKRGARGLGAPLPPRRPKEGPSAADRTARPGARGCPMPQERF